MTQLYIPHVGRRPEGRQQGDLLGANPATGGRLMVRTTAGSAFDSRTSLELSPAVTNRSRFDRTLSKRVSHDVQVRLGFARFVDAHTHAARVLEVSSAMVANAATVGDASGWGEWDPMGRGEQFNESVAVSGRGAMMTEIE